MPPTFSCFELPFSTGKSNDQSVILDYFFRRKINFGILTIFIKNEGKYNTGILSSLFYNIKKLVSLYFHSSYLCLFLAGNINVYPPGQGTNKEKYFVHHYIKVRNAEAGGKQTTFPSISSIIGRAFSIFRQKMDGPNPSEVDIEVFIPAPTYWLQAWYYKFP